MLAAFDRPCAPSPRSTTPDEPGPADLRAGHRRARRGRVAGVLAPGLADLIKIHDVGHGAGRAAAPVPRAVARPGTAGGARLLTLPRLPRGGRASRGAIARTADRLVGRPSTARGAVERDPGHLPAPHGAGLPRTPDTRRRARQARWSWLTGGRDDPPHHPGHPPTGWSRHAWWSSDDLNRRGRPRGAHPGVAAVARVAGRGPRRPPAPPCPDGHGRRVAGPQPRPFPPLPRRATGGGP